MDNFDLKKIEKYYGQKFARMCRELFPTILEKEGVLWQTIYSNFAPSHFLYEDVIRFKTEFQSYINSLVFPSKQSFATKSPKSVKQLFNEAGYILHPECRTEADIQKFKKYYAKGEELCTFKGDRLKTCRVWFATKKNIDDIKRENFKYPRRDDEYGTSIISIQFPRYLEENSNVCLSIKNRYNHSVKNPDATFSNNLDNIYLGLMQAFFDELGIKNNYDQSRYILENYIKAEDGKLYKSNIEYNNIHYCENNVIVNNGKVIKFDPSNFLLIDNFLIDLENKNISLYDKTLNDSFVDDLQNIKEICIQKEENSVKNIDIKFNEKCDATIKIDGRNNIIAYNNANIKELGKNFMYNNRCLKKLELDNVEAIDDGFLYRNEDLRVLDLPEVKTIKDNCLHNDMSLYSVNLPKVQKIGKAFGFWGLYTVGVYMDNLEEMGGDFLYHNVLVRYLNFPKLKSMGDCVLLENQSLEYLDLPSLELIGSYFMYYNNTLEKMSAQNLKQIGHYFLNSNKKLRSMSVPKITSAGVFALENHPYSKQINRNLETLIKKNVDKNIENNCNEKSI